jgi:hypothetical protein
MLAACATSDPSPSNALPEPLPARADLTWLVQSVAEAHETCTFSPELRERMKSPASEPCLGRLLILAAVVRDEDSTVVDLHVRQVDRRHNEYAFRMSLVADRWEVDSLWLIDE